MGVAKPRAVVALGVVPVAVVLVPVQPARLPPLEVMAEVMAVLVTLVRAVAPTRALTIDPIREARFLLVEWRRPRPLDVSVDLLFSERPI